MIKDVMKRAWTVSIDDQTIAGGESKIVIRQRKRTLTLSLKDIQPCYDKLVEMLREDHCCRGCVHLPTKGYYHSHKTSWCDLSREVANLYNDGYTWVNDDPPKKYLLVFTYFEKDQVYQSFHLFQGTRKKLARRISKIEDEPDVVELKDGVADLQWTIRLDFESTLPLFEDQPSGYYTD